MSERGLRCPDSEPWSRFRLRVSSNGLTGMPIIAGVTAGRLLVGSELGGADGSREPGDVDDEVVGGRRRRRGLDG
jgi:hypothetical protein